ncbi:lipoate--protein ligase [Aerococcus kribbianus]|uniref:lipoate--protein ligase n=1 Tax=Aerococcus kribbianus TaxID=2999064 RepID=A0A9X3FWX7_9LACT|nr:MULTISPECIES: lipoate--protein ligase [unclassified Aerococcus]MCZ0717749.1 lipoate--protein ligase [Aerococcus sp. YH-aer221]MCZ0726037.1 lipoate--protein ligase [Aerococcus sp. YH-aer222]
MYYVKNERHGEEIYDPSLNLAIEYYLLNEKLLDEPILLFYINQPSIIIGKNQNTRAEINEDCVKEHDVKVVRRFSGGGAVYHDYGNISFCFITKDEGDSFRDFKKFTKPVINALHKMGVEGAELQGRNDLLINGKKFSGNAMYSSNGRMTAHGTLMFDVDIDETMNVLKPKQAKLKSKGIKSVRSRVTNIKPYLDAQYADMTIKDFRTRLLLNIFAVDDVADVKEYVLTDEDWEQIIAFKEQYTGNDDWNFGENPDYEIVKDGRTPAGQIECHFNISRGHIQAVKIYGDFFGLGEISDVEEILTGASYDEAGLKQALKQVDINKYFGQITSDDLLEIML